MRRILAPVFLSTLLVWPVPAAQQAAPRSNRVIFSAGAARAVVRGNGPGKVINVVIDPPRAVGARTILRFRYQLSGATRMTVQMFDLTVRDNRHVNLTGVRQGQWVTQEVDFSRDSRRNDGGDARFPAGNAVDLVSFFVEPADGAQPVELYVDELVLFDAVDGRR